MQVSIETLEGLERRMTVQIPSERVTAAVEKKLKDLSKTVRIDGFRPGKVPLKVVQRKFGGHVRQEVIGDVIESSYQEALIQEKVRPAGMPSIDSVNSEEKQDMSYTATFEVYPEVEQLELASIEVEKPLVEVTDADFEDMLQKLREQRKTWKECKSAAQQGYQVMVDFEGRIDGEIFEGGAGKDMAVEIGAGQMLPEFEAGLEGIKAGEEKDVEVNFPEDYHGADVAGKTAVFTLKATRVSEPELPELNEEFAKGFGIEDGDLDKMRSDIRANMEKEKDDRLKLDLKNKVMSGLLENNVIIAPSALVAEEIKSLRAQAMERMGKNSAELDENTLPDQLFSEEATRRVQLGLLISEVIRQEKVEIDQALVDSAIEDMAIAYEQPDQVRDYYRQNQQARAGLESMVLEDQVVAHILEQAKVVDKAASFEDLMNGKL
ncbi:MAG: Cell division trigger factor (EC 5.2.1.8) [Olavius algarvensis Gamma 3 endosymbiont]|nr:MAG: Cell division trigger factor (EC 5.2.1.8) [Olavius algarvensis Gamma 3 endosymbiont]